MSDGHCNVTGAGRWPPDGGREGCILLSAPPTARSTFPSVHLWRGGACPGLSKLWPESGPWLFTKAMRPVVSHLRGKGHRMFAYIEDFFDVAGTKESEKAASLAGTRRAEQGMRSLFERFGLTMHPMKTEFTGSQSLEILRILVNTRA